MINVKKNSIEILILLILPFVFSITYMQFGDFNECLNRAYNKLSFLVIFVVIFYALFLVYFFRLLIILSAISLIYLIVAIIMYKKHNIEKYIDLTCMSYNFILIVDILICVSSIFVMNFIWIAFGLIYTYLYLKSKKKFSLKIKYIN